MAPLSRSCNSGTAYARKPLTVIGTIAAELARALAGLDNCRSHNMLYPIYYGALPTVSHTKIEKAKLLARVRRVRGQIEAVERTLDDEKGRATVLHLIVAARGAMNSLMTEVIEDHVRPHVVDPAKNAERKRGAEEVIEAVHAYLK
jgi:DNA-binding FrmR family transcriptional regulator